MLKRIKLSSIFILIIFIDILIVAIAIHYSLRPGNIPNWSFSVSDFIQLLVVEIALFGPMLIENWKKKRNRASISIIEINTQDAVENLSADPYERIYRLKIINNSDVLLKNCKVLLSEFRVEEKDERGVPKHIIIKNINRYLSWDSINDLALNLNPNEPTSVVIGKLVNKQVVL
jgi:hypothetical protein